VKDIIVVKNVDKNIYKRVKSVVALKGYTLGKALTEAMKLWLLLNEAASREYLEYLTYREKSERKLKEIQREYGEKFRNKYVVICNGELIKICNSEDEAFTIAGESRAIQCIVAQLGKKVKEQKIEMGMGVLNEEI